MNRVGKLTKITEKTYSESVLVRTRPPQYVCCVEQKLTVKIITARDCILARSAWYRASRASSTFACRCLRLRSFSNCVRCVSDSPPLHEEILKPKLEKRKRWVIVYIFPRPARAFKHLFDQIGIFFQLLQCLIKG
jgi:hypothetical protein